MFVLCLIMWLYKRAHFLRILKAPHPQKNQSSGAEKVVLGTALEFPACIVGPVLDSCVIKTPVLPSDPAPLPLQVDSHLTFGASYRHNLTSELLHL